MASKLTLKYTYTSAVLGLLWFFILYWSSEGKVQGCIFKINKKNVKESGRRTK